MTESVQRPTAATAQKGISFPSILVVEDDARYRTVLAYLLTGMASVECCAEGQAALARLRERHFDWVLLDLCLPGLDGFGVLAEIRRLDPAARVVIHTGMALPDARRRALAGGAVELLEKPLALEQLAALLAAASPHAQSGAGAPGS